MHIVQKGKGNYHFNNLTRHGIFSKAKSSASSRESKNIFKSLQLLLEGEAREKGTGNHINAS